MLLILTGLSLHGFVRLSGLALIVGGVATLLHLADRNDPRVFGLPGRVWGVLAGSTLVLLGGMMAVWASAGTPVLALVTGIGLIAHGLFTGVHALKSQRDLRAAGLLTASATIVFGVLSLTWPVLTLTLLRYGIGAWIVFLGLQLILGAVWGDAHRQDATTVAPKQGRRWVWPRTVGAALSLVLAVLLTTGSGLVLSGDGRPEPGDFYDIPANLPNSPGTLLSSEPLTVGVPSGAEAWKILYTTTHPDGSEAVSSGVVIVPEKRTAAALPLLTVAHGTTGIVPKCAPSLSSTPFADGAGTALTEMVTQHGWAGVISDYVGLGTEGPHPYLVGDAEARNVLDASRAAQQLKKLKLAEETIVWGHSQGGQASLWTGQIAEQYAPEIGVRGIAAFAPASDLYGLANADKSEAAGKTVSAYIANSWNKIYPELQLQKELTPGSAPGVAKISELCFNEKDALAAILHGSQVPNQVFPDSVLDGKLGDLLKSNSPTGPFPAPVFVAQGLADPLVKPKLQDDWVAAQCKAGGDVEYRTFPGLGHVDLVAADSPLNPQLIQWTLDRWEGKAATPNCKK